MENNYHTQMQEVYLLIGQADNNPNKKLILNRANAIFSGIDRRNLSGLQREEITQLGRELDKELNLFN